VSELPYAGARFGSEFSCSRSMRTMQTCGGWSPLLRWPVLT
jgi:hypothetical protein